jgi:hypothetical protein
MGKVAHACNPSYLGGQNQEDHGSRTAQSKSSPDLPQPMVDHWLMTTCHPSYSEKHKRESHDPGQGRQKSRPYLKNNQSKNKQTNK